MERDSVAKRVPPGPGVTAAASSGEVPHDVTTAQSVVVSETVATPACATRERASGRRISTSLPAV